MTDASTRPASIFSGRSLSRGERVQLAVLIGVAAAIAALLAFDRFPEMLARDFTYPWRGARAVLAGENPYDVIRPVGPSPFDMWFMYPLTAAVAAMPFARLPPQAAGAIFAGVSAALLTYALSARGIGRFWILLSAPFGMAVVLAQWSPLLIAGSLLLPFAWALTCKPIGLALYLSRPTLRATMVCAGFVLVTLAIQPTWITDWMRNAQTLPHHRPPVFHPVGAVALLALLRWRLPEARLVAAMAIMPQNLYFYDQLPLMMAVRTGRSTLAFSVLTWIAWGITRWRCANPYFCGPEAKLPVLLLLFVPATLAVLLREDGPEWIGSRWIAALRSRVLARVFPTASEQPL